MTLTGLNRTLVAQGLKVAKKRANIGYKVLAEVAAINEAVNCYHLGFVLGPRINAGGRVGKSYLGANLLSTTNEEEAFGIAKELERYNQERKAIEFAVMQEAIEIAKSQEDNSSIFVVGSGWHQGVIGIVAGRLKEKYNKPVAVITITDGIAKASCRSIKGVDYGGAILEAKLKGYVAAGGGHEMAAGFTATEDKLEELKQFLSTRFANSMKDSTAHITKYYECDLTTSSVNFDLLDKIQILEPFGNGNVPPTFRFSGVFVLKADLVANNHIRFILAPTKDAYGYKALQGIAFNAVGTPIADALLSAKAKKLDVLGQLKINKWQDSQSIQLQLVDIFG
jgi:single-stranded-DNA-specific exonuclease